MNNIAPYIVRGKALNSCLGSKEGCFKETNFTVVSFLKVIGIDSSMSAVLKF